MSFALVLTSPLERARTTCELAGLGDQAEIAPDLMEWNYGEYEGLTTKQIHAKSPRWMLFRDGCPGGESPEQVSARVDRVIAKIRAANGDVDHFCPWAYFESLCGSMAWIPSYGGTPLHVGYGDAKRPELLPRYSGHAAVECSAE